MDFGKDRILTSVDSFGYELCDFCILSSSDQWSTIEVFHSYPRNLIGGSPQSVFICASVRGFSALIRQAVVEQLRNGIPFGRGVIKLTYLFFANDSLPFQRADDDGV